MRQVMLWTFPEVGSWDLLPVGMSIPRINFWMPETILTKRGMYIIIIIIIILQIGFYPVAVILQ
jgi:hypothetical protein